MLKLASVLAASTLTLGCAITPEKWPHEPFTPDAWKAATWEERYVYYDDLAERGLLDGATRERVIELLGPPDGKNRPDNVAYLVRARPIEIFTFHCKDVRVLDIRLTPEGKVERYFIRGT